MDDHTLATEAARRAGDFLVELHARGGTGAEGDRQADDLILPFLREHRPDDAILSEESKDDPARIDAERVWIVDPLDGTREYGEAGRTDWAVHVALVVDQTPVAAAVALPAQDLVLSTEPTPTLAPATDGPDSHPRVAHAAAGARRRASPNCSTPSSCPWARPAPKRPPCSSVSATSTRTAAVSTNGTRPRRSASPTRPVATRSRLDGSPLRYNQPDPYLPDLLVCRPELADQVLAAITRATV